MNASVSIEINVHSLLIAILKCIELDSFQPFFPWMYSSQPCESFFRVHSSMSTTHSTIVNCTLLKSLQNIRRLQLLGEILSYDFQEFDEKIKFPRKDILTASFETQSESIDLSFIENICEDDSKLNNNSNQNILSKAKYYAL